MLSRAIVVESGRPLAGVPQDFGATLRRRLVGATREVALLEANVAKHLLDQLDVLRLSAVRRARYCELLITPFQFVESTGREKREHLKWLGAGAPEGE